MTINRFGWIPDLPDHRDVRFIAPASLMAVPLPSLVNLSAGCPTVYDQGDLGSCTANAIAAAIEFDRKKQKLPDFVPSRLFIYYNERVIEHSVNSDSGAEIRDGMKSVNKSGAPPETAWPYNVNKFKKKPPTLAYQAALHDKVIKYSRLNNQHVDDLRACLAGGYPFVYGFSVYDSFQTQKVANTGIVPMPSSSEQQIGGHAVLCVGYNDSTQRFLTLNSWGSDWGMKGYFTIPYQYLTDTDLADDFWTIQLVSAS